MLLPTIWPFHHRGYPTFGLEQLLHYLVILGVSLFDCVTLLVVMHLGPSLFDLLVVSRSLGVCVLPLHYVQQGAEQGFVLHMHFSITQPLIFVWLVLDFFRGLLHGTMSR